MWLFIIIRKIQRNSFHLSIEKQQLEILLYYYWFLLFRLLLQVRHPCLIAILLQRITKPAMIRKNALGTACLVQFIFVIVMTCHAGLTSTKAPSFWHSCLIWLNFHFTSLSLFGGRPGGGCCAGWNNISDSILFFGFFFVTFGQILATQLLSWKNRPS